VEEVMNNIKYIIIWEGKEGRGARGNEEGIEGEL